MDIIIRRLLIGFGINLVFGIIAFMTEMVDDMGFFAGVITFTLIYVFLDWQSYVIIVAFFTMTGLAINIENKDKARKGEFELYKAKRPIERVLGRSLAGAIFAGLFFVTNRPEFKLAFMASYAEAIFDTVATKLGKLLSKNAVLITNLKLVRHGTPGGVSWPGTMFGILAALIISMVGLMIRLIGIDEIWLLLVSAFIGSFLDSFCNAFSTSRKSIPNEFINFFGSISAGVICIWLQFILKLLQGNI